MAAAFQSGAFQTNAFQQGVVVVVSQYGGRRHRHLTEGERREIDRLRAEAKAAQAAGERAEQEAERALKEGLKRIVAGLDPEPPALVAAILPREDEDLPPEVVALLLW